MEKIYTLKSGRTVTVSANRKRISHTWGGAHYAYTAMIAVDGEHYKTAFHDSVANYWRGVSYPEGMTDSILECSVLDAFSYEQNPYLADFLQAYGYEYGSREGERAFNGCREASEQLRRMLSTEDLNEILEAVQ
jgi:hypothetical protein